MLYLDVMVCEDATLHNMPLSRVPSDYEKYFNMLEIREVDAIWQARGLCDSVRRFYTEAFANIQVAVKTRWGETPLLGLTKGFPQGSVSATEASKPAQEPVLRAREQSSAKYRTRAGRLVAGGGFVGRSCGPTYHPQ